LPLEQGGCCVLDWNTVELLEVEADRRAEGNDILGKVRFTMEVR